MAKKHFSKGRGRGRPGNFVQKNERIRAREMRVIAPDGSQVGVISKEDALRLAKKAGLDLVLISSSTRPVVCKILDYGKFQYEQSKKQKDHKQHTAKLKEVKLRVRIEQHDYMVKLRRAEDFLFKGNKVKLSLMYRGRENEHRELGFDVVNRAVKDLAHVGVKDTDPKLAGRNLILIMAPLPEKKRALKFNDPDDHHDPAPKREKHVHKRKLADGEEPHEDDDDFDDDDHDEDVDVMDEAVDTGIDDETEGVDADDDSDFDSDDSEDSDDDGDDGDAKT